jgi:nitrous oxidase accessory protein NosD
MGKNSSKVQYMLTVFLFFMVGTGALQAVSINVPSSQYLKIMQAVVAAKAGDTVVVEPGVYTEDIVAGNDVVLVSRVPLKAVFDGHGRRNVVTLNGSKCILSGFEIKNGIIGVFSKGAASVIDKCHIVNNTETGILCVGNLPKIIDNVIAFNGGSGIKGCELRTSAFSTINHNIITYNRNHGISIGGTFIIAIANNIIANNKRYGIKIFPEDSKVTITSNCFFENGITSNKNHLPQNNVSCDPNFRSPRRLDFSQTAQLKCMDF